MLKFFAALLAVATLFTIAPACDADTEDGYLYVCADGTEKWLTNPPLCASSPCAAGTTCETAGRGTKVCVATTLCK